MDSKLSSYTLVQGYVYKEEWHQGLFYIVYFIVLTSTMTMDWEIISVILKMKGKLLKLPFI